MRRTILLALLLLVSVSVVLLRTKGQAGTAGTKGSDAVANERWEYLAVAGPTTTNFTPTGNPSMRKEEGTFAREAFVLEQHLDKLGARGWELVSVAGPPTDPAYYFKRRR